MLKIKKGAITLSTTKLAILIGVAAIGTSFVVALLVAPQQVAEAVTTARDVICNGCVGTSDIADGAVTTSKLASGAIQLDVHRVQADLTLGHGQVGSVDIDCPSGEILTGGGFTTVNYAPVLHSFPNDENTWRIAAENDDSTATAGVVGYALCIDPSQP